MDKLTIIYFYEYLYNNLIFQIHFSLNNQNNHLLEIIQITIYMFLVL